MTKRTVGLQAKLFRVFAAQALLIGAAAIAGVYATAFIVEHVLVRAALQGEAEHFWGLYQQDPDVPLPNTQNLHGYMDRKGEGPLPPGFADIEPGFGRHELNGRMPIVFVSDFDDKRVYLVFDEEQVSELAFYFGIAPLSAVLLTIYLLMWLAFRQSRRAISPIVTLAREVEQVDPLKADLNEFEFTAAEGANSEVMVLINAIRQLVERLRRFLERERSFTRDASHELRTPLAVISGNADLLQTSEQLSASDKNAVERIKNTVRDMRELTETLMLLAHEDEAALLAEQVIVNDLMDELLDQLGPLIANSGNQVDKDYMALLEINASPQVLKILFTNLLRNALAYTDQGTITVQVSDDRVAIHDTGRGISAQDLEHVFEPFVRAGEQKHGDRKGHGLGLAIVKRLCDRHQWRIVAESELGVGTTVAIVFKDSGLLP